ncbi:MAG: aconitate hydratase AcnA [Planctomycetes bacterium]|nr:aconitate hydratase AcnA [Planctomycetota bacterium]
MRDSYGSASTLNVGPRTLHFWSLKALERRGLNLSRLPFSLRILLEGLLSTEDGVDVTAADIEALAKWDPKAEPSREIAFSPARVLMQDFTGVPAVVDLAAMRDAMRRMGGDPRKINPLCPAELVIDHSVQVDEAGTPQAFLRNAELEFTRNHERYAFLRWGQKAFDNFKVVPPDTGIVHQVNLEFLARVVMTTRAPDGREWAFPDTLVGTDSHTTMINGLGVLGWGVGGIEAEAAMLGQPVSMLIPQVVGFRLSGRLAEGATATDAVLTVTEMLRKKGVVGKFVEFFGEGLADLPLADRATIANMAPEYGATCGIFPVDQATLDYLRLTGRPDEQVRLVETYMREQGLFRIPSTPDAEYTDVIDLDLSKVEPCVAGPKRPQDRIRLGEVKQNFAKNLPSMIPPSKKAPEPGSTGFPACAPASAPSSAAGTPEGAGRLESPPSSSGGLSHGSIVIAAITSCTNTSNPSVMMAAGLVAKKAAERGLQPKPWVKSSLAPGSRAVTDYLKAAGLLAPLEQMRFHVVGYGCTTCIGNSGPLPAEVSRSIDEGALVVASVLSGNRNFEGRVHAEVRANYLMSPPLVVAHALAGRVDVDLTTEPLGAGRDGRAVYLRDIWPTQAEVAEAVRQSVRADMFRASYANVYSGDERWSAMKIPEGDTYVWDAKSTYVKHPPYFVDMPAAPAPVRDIAGARVLAVFGDSITTDHISPAGSIKAKGPAGLYLQGLGVGPADFNSYGARRGNHEVMMRGTFANVRLRNRMVTTEGGLTVHQPDGKEMSIYDASMAYKAEGVPLVILAGKEYGSGSSRDWAAKGPMLLGVRAVIAESFERIHRSNLVGMGVAPLQFKPGENAESLGLTGREVLSIDGLAEGLRSGFAKGRHVTVRALREDGAAVSFTAIPRIDTPKEIEYMKHGGILQYVLRRLLAGNR